MAQSEPNISLTGDQARILMYAMINTNANAPVGATLDLYLKLAAISQVQPPRSQPAQEASA